MMPPFEKNKLPEIVYKYRSWSNDFHKKILLNNELYLARPSDFNDPFDCQISANYLLIEDYELEDFIWDVLKTHKPHLIDVLEIIEEKNKLRRRFANREQLQAEYEILEFEGYDNHTGVVSFSAKWNNILMWAHYADSHKGFCIGFKEEKLRNSNLFGKGGLVNYLNDYPQIKPDPRHENPIDTSFIKTHTKSKDWEYEEEYRLVSNSYPDILERIVAVPTEYISEVILGIAISEIDKQEIIKETSRRHIPTFQAFKVPFRFEMDRRRII